MVSRLVLTSTSPLKPAELQVLRAQYEKEGDYVGVQTKFNYAWVYFSQNIRPFGLCLSV
jgi:fission 1 protein